MEKDYWLGFLTSKKRTFIAQDAVRKVETWACLVLAIWALSQWLSLLQEGSHTLIFGTKFFFILCFHLLSLIYLSSIFFLGDKQKSINKLFGVRDFKGLTWMGLLGFTVLLSVVLVSQQIIGDAGRVRVSDFFGLNAWVNFVFVLSYLILGAGMFFGFHFWPGFLNSVKNKLSKTKYVFYGFHAYLFTAGLFNAAELEPFGSGGFFQLLSSAVIVWILLISIALTVSFWFKESYIGNIEFLESDIISGRVKEHKEIVLKFHEAFIGENFIAWVHGFRQDAGKKVHEIAGFAHQAVSLAGKDDPSQIDVLRVEEQYKKAQKTYRRLEKQRQRFQIALSVMDLNHESKDYASLFDQQFSQEVRNAQLELFSIRKRIDEKIMSFKNNQLPSPETKKTAEELTLN